MLELRNIHKTFNPHTPNEKVVFSGLDLSLAKGEFVTVIGSNGAGKSTLFSVVAGNHFVDEGFVILGDMDATYLPEYKRSAFIGRLFQDPLKGTAPNMTIEENLALAYLRAGGKKGMFSRITKENRAFFIERLKSLDIGLEERLTHPVGLLSGGQRQALTLLMATLVPPEILLLDEYTSALDPSIEEKVLTLTKEIVEENNITCMMITHDIELALKMGNRTIMMDNGNIVLDLSGVEREEMTMPKLLDAFQKKTATAFNDDRSLLRV